MNGVNVDQYHCLSSGFQKVGSMILNGQNMTLELLSVYAEFVSVENCGYIFGYSKR